MSLPRLYRTIRHLRPIQVYNRVGRKLRRPRFHRIKAPQLRPPIGGWIQPAERAPSLVGPNQIRVFQHEYAIADHFDWNANASHLVAYNLHYFDDLTAQSSGTRCDWHMELIQQWIQDNPIGRGVGWEPYPLSLRIVNWIKWQLAGNYLSPEALESLATQSAALMEQLEYHLLGNHLLANAKALVFAGCFFSGPLAEHWLDTGIRILSVELPEQILADGGHFERSPMYHSIILEDLLDLLNLRRTFGSLQLDTRLPQLETTLQRMRSWLATMSHPDGGIAFFNDAAHDVAISPKDLERYAQRLELADIAPPAGGLNLLAESGYVRLQRAEAVVLLDVAKIGPAYQPGHAHADTLSFEMSLSGARLLVNSGTSCYGLGEERERQRGTAAHNTIVVDGENSSEVWRGFRVARRATPFDLRLEETAERLMVACSHDGYRHLPGQVTHRRKWTLEDDQLRVEDTLTGQFGSAIARFHFHPDVELAGIVSDSAIPAAGTVEWEDGVIHYRIENGSPRCLPTTYHPRFEVELPNFCVESTLHGTVHALLLHW